MGRGSTMHETSSGIRTDPLIDEEEELLSMFGRTAMKNADRISMTKTCNATATRRATLRGALSIVCILGLAMAGVSSVASAKGQGKAKGKNKGVYLLGQAKQASQVGEKPDGYLGLVDEEAPENIKKMVKDTNERRLGRYKEVSVKGGRPLKDVEKLAGEKLYKRAKPGEMLLGADGKWMKKE